jgi:hypothetical protein
MARLADGVAVLPILTTLASRWFLVDLGGHTPASKEAAGAPILVHHLLPPVIHIGLLSTGRGKMRFE